MRAVAYGFNIFNLYVCVVRIYIIQTFPIYVCIYVHVIYALLAIKIATFYLPTYFQRENQHVNFLFLLNEFFLPSIQIFSTHIFKLISPCGRENGERFELY